LKSASIETDVGLLIKALDLKKDDRVLDIACGQGRHTNYLAQRGYRADGVDFSSYLIDLAQKETLPNGKNNPKYFIGDVENLDLKEKYTKAFWFFSDFAGINLKSAICSIGKYIISGRNLLIDSDNLFRIIEYFYKNKKSKYKFDPKTFELIDNNSKIHVPYPTYEMWQRMFFKNNFNIISVL